MAPADADAFTAGSSFQELIASVRDSSVWTTMAVADRVHSDDDPDALQTALRIAPVLGHVPLVHVAGKGRSTADTVALARRCAESELDEVLLMTGDRIKDRARERAGSVPYADAVNLVEAWLRHAPKTRRGVVVNPFKHVEEDLRNQLLKLALKVASGADAITIQIGFSWDVYEGFLSYARSAYPGVAVRAAVCHLPVGIANVLARGEVPGVVLPAALADLIRHESPEAGAREAYARRTAVQIAALWALGYDGVQVACVHGAGAAARIASAVEALLAEGRSIDDLARMWAHLLPERESSPYPFTKSPAPGLASLWERVRYRGLDAVDHAVFDPHDPRGAVATRAIRGIAGSSAGRAMLKGAEAISKRALVGCRMCGFCRLPHTMYVCPETCPKGLANGPCGGTDAGRCEFGDRECIHNMKYRTAQAFGRESDLARIAIPPVPEGLRGTSSWINHVEGREPSVARLEPASKAAEPAPDAPTAASACEGTRDTVTFR